MIKAQCQRKRDVNKINRGSYMNVHVLLNLLNVLGKRDKCEDCRAFYISFATSLINLMIQEFES